MNQHARYVVEVITDLFILIRDLDSAGCLSVTDDAGYVVRATHEGAADLSHRRLYYEDSTGLLGELRHDKGRFIGFAHISESQEHLLLPYLL